MARGEGVCCSAEAVKDGGEGGGWSVVEVSLRVWAAEGVTLEGLAVVPMTWAATSMGGHQQAAVSVNTGDEAVLRRVEEAVEVLARAGLETSCALEQKQQQRHVDLARRRPKGEERDGLLEKALAFEMASCDRLAQFGRPGAGRKAAAAA